MRKLALLIAMFAMISLSVGFSADLEPVKRSAGPGSPAIFTLTVQNNGTNVSRYSLSSEFTKSGWMYYPSSKTLEEGETTSFNITIAPGEDALQQSISFKLYLTETSTGRTKTFSEYMNVKRDYKLNVQSFSVEKTTYLPGETVKASITVQNLVPSILTDYSFRSALGDRMKTVEGKPIAPKASKTYYFAHKLSEEASPGKRNLSVKLFFENENRTFSEEVTIREVRKVNRSMSVKDRVVRKSGRVFVENLGNSKVSLTENLSFPSYIDPVLEFSRQPDRVLEKGEQNVYVWSFSLAPGESFEVSYDVDYWMPLAIAFTILAGVLILRRLSGNMVIRKRVEEDGEELKVSLEIINNTEKTKEKVRISDFVPNVAELDEDFEMAEPDLKRTVDGIEMEWTLEDFRPDEKRAVQYKIKPKVDVEGGIDLPRAEIAQEGTKIADSDRK